MTPASFLRDLAAFWVQIAFVVVVVAALLKVVSIPARARYVCLRLSLLLCLLAPWTLRSAGVVAPEPPSEQVAGPVEPLAPGPVERLTAALPRSATAVPARVLPDIPWATVALFTLFAGVAARGLWLAVGVWRLRRLRRRAMPVDSPDYAAAQQQIGTSATIAQVEGLPQPVTFGFRRPIVLLPDTLAVAPAALRRAVVTHELFHVRRRDWLSVLGEEALRTMLWFHPAILWLTSHIQLAREEMVDELTVRATGDRRAYMEALLAFADTGGLRPAPAFARRRQLFHRILSVSKERVMSAPRIVMSIGVLTAAICGASWYASTLFPIVVAARADTLTLTTTTVPAAAQGTDVVVLTDESAARLQQSAAQASAQRAAAADAQDAPHEVTPENPIPRRTRGVQPAWPSQFAGQRYGVVVTTLVRIARDGSVTNVFDKGCGVTPPSQSDRAVCGAFFEASAAAIRQWRYDRPVQAPLQFSVVLTFRPGAEAVIAQSPSDWLSYVRETQDSLRTLAEQTGGIAVVNQRDFDQGLRNVELQQRVADLSNLLRELERAQRLALERGPANPDLVKLQQDLARLNDEVARVEQQMRNTRRQQGADQLTTDADELRVAVERLLRQPEQTTTAAVSPMPAPPVDGSRQLVSPSGRAPLRMNGAPPPGLQQPTPTKSVKPTYSPEAMESRLQGTVVVEVLVDERGRVADARVLRGISQLDPAALDAAKQWEFRPAMLNGEPMPVLVVLEMHFTLK